jgi:hypothetical protein
MDNSTQILLSYQKNKMVVWGAFGLVALLVYFYFKGKKDGKLNIPDASYPDGGKGVPHGWNPNVLAEKLFSVLDGFLTLAETKVNVLKELNELGTDDMMVAVYNVFNKKYGDKGQGSLTQWIKDEILISKTKDQVLKRLESLRLT